MKTKSRVHLTSLISVTAGGAHAWYNTDEGFPVRKPVDQRIATTGELKAFHVASAASAAKQALKKLIPSRKPKTEPVIVFRKVGGVMPRKQRK